MKKMMVIALMALIGTSAFAGQTISCKKIDEATAQGYEAKVSSKKAVILLKGRKVAELVFISKQESDGGDQYSVSTYSQNELNGYRLEVRSGGLSGRTMATILHGGVAGFTTTAQLNDCK